MIFNMEIKNVEMLNNKCLFAQFMMKHYPKHIPLTISIMTDQIDYLDIEYLDQGSNVMKKMIKKCAIGCAGIGTSVIREFDQDTREKDHVISEYMEHTEYYTGHFLVHRGAILRHVIFMAKTPPINDFIKKGPIGNYTILDSIDIHIFERIFKRTNYSGFACSDFIISDNLIIIFEINPRPGGSLIANEHYCAEFFAMIKNLQISD
jgi:predicted ATP-grasp superfamily ATP-dependent carboligase